MNQKKNNKNNNIYKRLFSSSFQNKKHLQNCYLLIFHVNKN